MKTEREMLEFAAKACGIEQTGYSDVIGVQYVNGSEDSPYTDYFNPLNESKDCAAMCAKLEIHTQWWNHSVACISNSGNDKRDVKHDGTDAGKEAAWRYAATIVAAKIGGMK